MKRLIIFLNLGVCLLAGCAANTKDTLVTYSSESTMISENETTSYAENEDDELDDNFLGGKGALCGNTQFAEVGQTCVIEDAINYYFAGYCIPKNGDTAHSLCNSLGCSHDTDKCLKFFMSNSLAYCGNTGYCYEQRKLYKINEKGDKEFVTSFDMGEDGEKIEEDYICISNVIGNDEWIYVVLGNGYSRLYNIKTQNSLYFEADDIELMNENCVYKDYENHIYILDLKNGKKERICNDFKNIYSIEGDFLSDLYFGDGYRIYRYSNGDVSQVEMDIDAKWNANLMDINNGKLIYSLNDYDRLFNSMTFSEIHVKDETGDVVIKAELGGLISNCGNMYFYIEGLYDENEEADKVIHLYNIETDNSKKYNVEG